MLALSSISGSRVFASRVADDSRIAALSTLPNVNMTAGDVEISTLVTDAKGANWSRTRLSATVGMVSEDETTAGATVRFTDRAVDIDEDHIEAAQDAFAGVGDLGVQVEFGGAALDVENHPSGSEAIGLAAAVLVLLLAFGSVFAMLVPLITAVLARSASGWA